MNHETKFPKLLLAIGLLAIGISFSAWQSAPNGNTKNNQTKTDARDTTKPSKRHHAENEYRVGNIDEAMKQLDEQMAKLNEQMSKMDFSKMEKDMKKAMKEVEKIDFSKIEKEVNESLKNVDWKKVQSDVDKAMQEVKQQMHQVNLEKMHVNLEKMKVNLEKQKIKLNLNAGKIRQQVEEGMAHAKVGMEKAKEELQNLKSFTDELEKDGLISKKKGYSIKVEDGELYINGTKQSKEIYDKYKQYYKKEKFSIKSDGENTSSI